MHVYRPSLRAETEERKGHLALSSDCESFPAAVGADWCLSTWGSLLRSTQCLPNAFLHFSLAINQFRAAQMATGPGRVTAYNCLPIAQEILHSQKTRKKDVHTACSMEAPHTSPGKQSTQTGCHSVFICLLFFAFDDTI